MRIEGKMHMGVLGVFERLANLLAERGVWIAGAGRFCGICTVYGSLCLLAPSYCDGRTWKVESIDTHGEYPDMAIDTNDHIHISYQGPGSVLKYAYHDGVVWTNSQVGTGTVRQTSIDVLHGSALPVISYIQQADADLMCATSQGLSWDIETVDAAGVLGDNSIAIDSSDTIYIAYRSESGNATRLVSKVAGAWGVEPDLYTGESGYGVSVDLDSASILHVSHARGADARTVTYTRYGDLPLPVSKDVTNGIPRYGRASIAVDLSTDLPRMAYCSTDSGGIYHATLAGSTWITETVEDISNVAACDMAIDTNGHSLIAFYDKDNSELKLAAHDGTNWTIETVANMNSNYVSIALSGDGAPRITYYDSGLKVASPGYGLTVTSDHGNCDPSPGVHGYSVGETISCSVTNTPVTSGTTQFVCVGWTGTESVPASGSGTNTGPFAITNDSAIVWQWGTNYWLDTGSNVGGSVDVADDWFVADTNVTITATASNSHNFSGWIGDTGGCAIVANVTTVPMDGPRVLSAVFDRKVYAITATAGSNGSIAPIGTISVAHGDDTNFVISADADYHIAGLLVDGSPVPSANQYAFSSVTTGHTIHASFAEDVGWISATIDPPAVNSLGAQWRLTTGPDTNWHTSAQIVGGVSATGAPYTVTFSDVAHWQDPGDVAVGIAHAATTAVHAVYRKDDMVLISGGTFEMGICNGQGGHSVTLSDFMMDADEVTVGAFQAFCAATAHSMPDPPPWAWGDTNLPIVNVTWNEAAAYAAWIGKRLPTEAEYEYAMRSGASDQNYPWGNTITSANANYWSNIGQPTAGGTYPPSAYGLYDIAGNVWSWCSDWYESVLTGPVSDPTGPLSGALKCIRGGSWVNSSFRLRSCPRFSLEPTISYVDVGLRCAQSVAPSPSVAPGSSSVPDWWQLWYFGLTSGGTAAFDRDGDPDADGMSNADEFASGTNPTDRGSVLKVHVEPLLPPADGYAIRWPSAAGKLYAVEHSTNLVQGFSVLVADIPGIPPVNCHTVVVSTTSLHVYRVTVQH